MMIAETFAHVWTREKHKRMGNGYAAVLFSCSKISKKNFYS